MLADLCLETTNAPGSNASITLLGAAAGRRSFNTSFGVGPSFYYVLQDGTNYEIGVGSLSNSTTLNRTTVLSNSAGTTSRIVFSGLTNCYNSLPASRFPYRDTNLRLQMAGQRIEGLAASAGADHAVRQDQVLMLASGGTVAGTITATRLASDSTFYSELSGGMPVVSYDTQDYQHYNRSTNTWSLVTSAATRFYVNDTDAVISGIPLTLTNGGSGPAHATRRDYVDASVNARLSLAGGQVNGNLTVVGAIVATAHIQTYNSSNGSQGTIYLNSTNTRYLSNDGSNYVLPGQHLFVNGSAVWTQGNIDPMPKSGGGFSGGITAPSLSTSGDINASGRVQSVAPRGVGSGFAVVDAAARFGSWQWVDAGTYIQIDIDGQARSVATNASDARMKQDVVPSSRPALPDIRKIEFKDFRFKKLNKTPADCTMPLQRGGFIAQQMITIRPEWIDTMGDEWGTLAPNTLLLLSNALQGVQEVDAILNSTKAEVVALKAELAALKATVNELLPLKALLGGLGGGLGL